MAIGFIGFGNMGQALGVSMAQQGGEAIYVADPNLQEGDLLVNNWPDAIQLVSSEAVFKQCDLVFLAVKPQMLTVVSSKIASYIRPHHVVVSMLAGVSIAQLSKELNTNKVVRIMPNTPAMIGKGVTGICFGLHIEDSVKKQVVDRCNQVGDTIVIEDEFLMHTITALSGSGPAFFYRMVDVFATFATNNGVPKDVAVQSAISTMLGSAEMLKRTPNPSALIDAVTSPNGTTQAGLMAMDRLEFDHTLYSVLTEAKERSIALSKGRQ